MSNSLQESIQKKQELRYATLLKIYEMSPNEDELIETPKLATALNRTIDELTPVLDYLQEERLIEVIGDQWFCLRIEHRGLVEIESSINQPTKSTEHFQPSVIHNVYVQGNLIGYQSGGQNNTQNVTVNTVNAGAPIEEIIKLIELTKKAELPELVKEEAVLALDRVKQLADKPKSEEVVKLAKDKLDIFKNSIDVGKTLGEIALPLLVKLYTWFS